MRRLCGKAEQSLHLVVQRQWLVSSAGVDQSQPVQKTSCYRLSMKASVCSKLVNSHDLGSP